MSQQKYKPVKTNQFGDEPNPESTYVLDTSSPWIIIWRLTNLLMSVFFLLCAYVQLNDPDPVLWIPIYLVPACLSLSIVVAPTITDNTAWKICAIIEIAASLVVGIYTTVLLAEFIAWNNPLQYEEGRELAGLVIAIIWISVCRFTTFGSSNPGQGAAKALLLMTSIIALLPMVLWGMCFLDRLAHFGHCKDMFPGMLRSF